MPNRAIEFHDSTLLSVTIEADVHIHLSAYVHESEREPGRDGGTGWEQNVEFLLKNAVVETAPMRPFVISDGRLQVG
jgi:hypothetical protein